MAHRITGAYEHRTKIDIILPYTEAGEPAFTDDGDPVKGAEPVTVTLPRYNYMPMDELKSLMKAAEEVDKRALSEDYNIFDRQRDSVLESLRPLVDDTQYKVLHSLTIGELVDLNQEWSRQSETPLGESSASNGSSKSTRRPSSTTSSARV
jgi:hypothetical protein